MTAPIRSIPEPAELLGTVRTLQDAVEVFRVMKERLGITNQFIDDAGGLTKGHADKILGRTGTRGIGYDTFALFCELFAVEFRVYLNMDAVKRMEQVWDEKAPRWFADPKPGRISKKILDAAEPLVFQRAGKRGREKQLAMQDAQHRSRIASKAAKSRWRKHRKRRTKRQCVATPSTPAKLPECQIAGQQPT